jgi:hypothetical protein
MTKDSELFNFDPETVKPEHIEQIRERMKLIVARNRTARSLKTVEEQRALEEEAAKKAKKAKAKTKTKKPPLMERPL